MTGFFSTERAVIEGICASCVLILSMGVVSFLDLAPLTSSLKTASLMSQKFAFLSISMCIYLLSRAYFALSLASCDKVVAIVHNDEDTQSEAGANNSSSTASSRAWLWRFFCICSTSGGFIFVYCIVPGGGAIVNEAFSRLLGDLPQILGSSMQKDSIRVVTRGKRILGLCFAYFIILFLLELILRAVLLLLAAIYRKLVGAKADLDEDDKSSEVESNPDIHVLVPDPGPGPVAVESDNGSNKAGMITAEQPSSTEGEASVENDTTTVVVSHNESNEAAAAAEQSLSTEGEASVENDTTTVGR